MKALGGAHAEGRWAQGPAPDGKGQFEYVASPKPMTDDVGALNQVDPRLYGTLMMPVPKAAAE